MANEEIARLLSAIEAISPMPDDEALANAPERLEEYASIVEAIRTEVGTRYDKEVIGVLLRSFGLGDGFEVYWTTLHFIESFRAQDTTYALIRETLMHGQAGPRKWSCVLLARRRNRADLPLLLTCLGDDEPEVVKEALEAIRIIASGHPSRSVLRDVEALASSARADIARVARDTLDALIRSSDDTK